MPYFLSVVQALNMKTSVYRITALFVFLTVPLWIFSHPLSVFPQEEPNTWEVYFSPNGGCTDAIVRELDKAQVTVLVQAYSFTSYRIAEALLDAHKRGVKVEVILDKSQRTDQYSSADFLSNSGIPTKIDGALAVAYNKVMIIDGEIVVMGSFNFTKSPEEINAENLLVIHDWKLAERCTMNWKEHEGDSEVYMGKGR